MASSSSTTVIVRKHDVFLSFYGVDTRNTFTSTLHGILKSRSIDVFIDYELKRGEHIPSSLMNEISNSMISVIIFSQGYASSRWCLEELVKIIECRNTQKQVVIPVFYHINPSDVRKQTGIFGKGFENLVESYDEEKLETVKMTEEQFKDKVLQWKNALTEAANISGRSTEEQLFDYSLANKVVEDIWNHLDILIPTNDCKKLVGVESIIYEIKYLLRRRLRNVHAIGIWGMPGIGKTTIANCVFNQISGYFEGSYFATNIREESVSPNGLNLMRQELLSTILEHPCLGINSKVEKGRLSRKQVLIVFDDVTTLSQIECLVGDIYCFGPRSRIIITTTDRQVLRSCGVGEDYIYEMMGLREDEALQLFRQHAFQQSNPSEDYVELSKRVVKYAEGVPLALKVLGRCLRGKSKQIWESAINRLEIIPNKEIQDVLKVCYDGLDNDVQNIFLDIACFLKWENIDFVMGFLSACGLAAEFGLSVLIDKCLITISRDNKVTMHSLLQYMGREIVRQECTKNPGLRSRLWYHKDIYNVLEENKMSNAIEGISLDMSKQAEIIHLQHFSFEVMDQLRFFKLYNSHYEVNNINKVYASDEFRFVSNELRYVCWHGCPLKSLQPNFWLKNLVALDMPYSQIEQLWSSTQLDNLEHIDLSFSEHLRSLDLSLTPNLKILVLEGCKSFREILSSIQGCIYELHVLNLRGCKSLDGLPTDIPVASLEIAFFSGCSKLQKFPQVSWDMRELYLDETAIEELPLSIENLSRLVILNLKDCSMLRRLPSNFCQLKSLEHLNLSGCLKLHGLPDELGNLESLRVLKAERVTTRVVPTTIPNLSYLEELYLTNCSIGELPDNLGQLSSLKKLLLGRNFFYSIPESIAYLSKLSYLDVSHCDRLQILPNLPTKLKAMDANSCISLETSLSSFRGFLYPIRINFCNCFKLDHNYCRKIMEQFYWSSIYDIPGRLERGCFPKNDSGYICFPGSEIPKCFHLQRTGSFITLPSQAYFISRVFNSSVICVVLEFRDYHHEGKGFVVGFEWSLTGEDGAVDVFHGILRVWDNGTGPDYVNSDHVFLAYDLTPKFSIPFSAVNKIYHEISFQFHVENSYSERLDRCRVKKCGVSAPALGLDFGLGP